MPRRADLKSILVIGSGPIVIGQACEFDYSGSQACKSLREEGYRVILINSNPATVMTDPEMADRTYVEPLTVSALEKICREEKPDAILPTLGGQTGLNLAMEFTQSPVFKELKIEMLGATAEVIAKAEEREAFKKAMANIGLEVPRSISVHTIENAREAADTIGFPVIIRPAFTLGGVGGGVAYNKEEFEVIATSGLNQSMNSEILIEESIAGWKEYELEVMRDHKGNVVIICSIENVDAMGVHTGDSITVAPAQTLTDREYQLMRDAAIAIMGEIGVETGGSNVQFAVNPQDGRLVVIEMNPRVSRSSALASKATGFPIAKIAAKLAVGYSLDELSNDITQETPACFEPTIDYVVTKFPRWAFEKFPEADTVLGTQMKSVGEVMAIGRTFKESFQKAVRGLEIGRHGFGSDLQDGLDDVPDRESVIQSLRTPNEKRIFSVRHALLHDFAVHEISHLSGFDPWFVAQMFELVEMERKLAACGSLEKIDRELMLKAKRYGFSDIQLGCLLNSDWQSVRQKRLDWDLKPVYKLVDTCAGEFEASTPYFYSTWGEIDEMRVSDRPKIIILGGGPNRIGQGIEFDYCCCHASFGLRKFDYETIMINSNPETVSTDYDTSDQLYFEPLTLEDVLNITDRLQPQGVIVQFGGQTPLKLCKGLEEAGVPIIGTSPDAIDRAEDRERFKALVDKLGLLQPPNGMAQNPAAALAEADRIGYPVVVRPSYVLGGRAMEIVHTPEQLQHFMDTVVQVSTSEPVLIDKFLDDAIECDVDAVCDGQEVLIGGILEHIEEAGIHSGDSTAVLPPFTLSKAMIDRLKDQTKALAVELKVVGLMNVQFAIKGDDIYLLEVNPRASRTVPFIAKAIGLPLAQIAALAMVGKTFKELGVKEIWPEKVAVKEPVFPFQRFRGVDILLGPEMRSTGEVMGWDESFGMAVAKAKMGARLPLPDKGAVFVSVKDADKRSIIPIAQQLHSLGMEIVATLGTQRVLSRNGVPARLVYKIGQGRPDVLDEMKNGQIQLLINTPAGAETREHEKEIRALSVQLSVPCITTLSAAQAAVQGIRALKEEGLGVFPLQQQAFVTI